MIKGRRVIKNFPAAKIVPESTIMSLPTGVPVINQVSTIQDLAGRRSETVLR